MAETGSTLGRYLLVSLRKPLTAELEAQAGPVWVHSPARGDGLGRVNKCGHQGPPPGSAGQKLEWSPLGRPEPGEKTVQ